MSRTVRVLTVLAVLAGALGAGAGAASAQQPAGQLYVVQADAGRLRHDADGWRLVLKRSVDRVSTFTDRPARVGATQSLKRFVAGWSRAFGDDPPNAALELNRAPASRDVALLELEKPRYDARRGTLTFRVRPLSGTRQSMLRELAARADRPGAGTFGRASLFIDDGSSGIGYTVSLNLFGGAPGTDPQTFSLSLDNTQFAANGQIIQSLSEFGSFTTPSIATGFSAQSLSLSFAGNVQVQGSVDVLLPSSGTTVTGNVVLPPYYQLQITSEAGQTLVTQSGPVTFPAPAAPS